MARVTPTEVKAIMNNCTVADDTVDIFILGATQMISKVFSGDTTTGSNLLKEIERWLAAHMIATTPLHRISTEETVGQATIKYAGKFGEGLKSTPYGQMVLQLDVTGKMGKIGKGEASIYAVTGEDS